MRRKSSSFKDGKVPAWARGGKAVTRADSVMRRACRLVRCTGSVVLSFVMGDRMPLVLDKFDQGFFDDVGEGTVVFARQGIQVVAEPFFAFSREINVQVGHILIRHNLSGSGISCYNRL